MFKRRISYLALLSVMLCVFIVVIVMTVLRGLVTDFKQKNHDFVGDCVVSTESLVGFAYYEDFIAELKKQDYVVAISPVIKSFALVNPQGGDMNLSLELMGIDPARHSEATGFGRSLYHRRENPAKAFEPKYDANLPGLVMCIDRMLLRNSDGEYSYHSYPARIDFSVSCFPLNARGVLAKAGLDLFITKVFSFSDHSHSGLAHEDYLLVYLDFEWAQRLCGMDGEDKRISAIHIKFAPGVDIEQASDKVSLLWGKYKEQKSGLKLSNLLDNVTVHSWREHRRAFTAGMEKEQTMMTAMFVLVGVTTVFIVFVVFYMIVSHKSKDIGILKSVGVGQSDLIGLYLSFALLVGMIGSLVGVLGGWLFLAKINTIEDWLFERFGFSLWDRTIFAIGDIPNQLDLEVLVVIVFSAILACLIGALVPSWQAARLNPVETLQVGRL
jgi:lipoprotein-releasing system permease protein